MDLGTITHVVLMTLATGAVPFILFDLLVYGSLAVLIYQDWKYQKKAQKKEQ